MSDVPETPRATPGGVPAGAEDRTAAGGAAGADAPPVEVPQLVTNPRVLELWRELNVLAETDADAAAIVHAYAAWNAFMEASKQVAAREHHYSTREIDRIAREVNAPKSLVEMLRWRADEIEQHRTPAGPSVVMLLRDAAAALAKANAEPSPNTVRERLDEMRRRRTAASLTYASLVRCASCNTMTHIPTGTVCALCLGTAPIERSSTPMFSSKLPEPGAAGGAITHEDLKGFADQLVVRGPVYGLNREAWRTYLEADERFTLTRRDDMPICEHGLAVTTCYECSVEPRRKLPKHARPHAPGSCDCPAGVGACTVSEIDCRVRAYHNSRLSVRSWFRKMRAADFEKALPGRGLVKWVSSIEAQPWTVLDTQKVVNRETAAFYLVPKRDELWFTEGGRILGGITGIYFDGTQ